VYISALFPNIFVVQQHQQTPFGIYSLAVFWPTCALAYAWACV
jgi:hypothetical protein